MKIQQKHKINFSITPKGDLLIYRDHKKELTIFQPPEALIDNLSQVLKIERDYEAYLTFFGKDDQTPLSSWLFNYIANSDPDILDLFKTVAIRAN